MGERFSGFPDGAVEFFAELEGHNERAWWLANKDRFDSSVAGPMRALLDELEPEFGPFKVFRMNRDVRFSRDKTPYKTAHAAMTDTGGAADYVQIGAAGVYAGSGMYHLAADQLDRFRRAVDNEATGTELQAAIATSRRSGLDVTGPEPALTTAPRGFAKDHPRIELLRMKGCVCMRDLGAGAWLGTRRAVGRITRVWRDAAPVTAWLDANVGRTAESR